ncbi:DUF1292 domain-containing protein [Bacillus sp. USDA818B3_A]|uniref:DUF1292 domain-containing protein n=1 Tax=Bacillus sp. USDA818B3_A TaxID=2698834 RepID=UPI00136B3D67|nr:DUF1292 domain-containing protein [Bacillus sp. USDA818B3_A]
MAHEHNHEEEERYITLVDENGDEQLFEILFTFDSDEFEKSYVFFYPVGANEDEEEEIDILTYAYIPTEDGGFGELMEIETDEEWDMVEEVFNTFNEEQEEE